MIASKSDYRYYLKSAYQALKIKSGIKDRIFNPVYKFEKLMRKCEYYLNCRKDPLGKLYFLLLKFIYRKRQIKLGFSIPLNVFGPGLSIAHFGNIVINNRVSVGANCRIHVGVNIGAAADNEKLVPIIGDNVYIGPGAKIFGSVVIGNNTVIGANSVVNKSFPEGNQTIGGIPARAISQKGSFDIITWERK